MKKLYLDLETYCDVPIKRGTFAYAAKADILIVAYAWADGPVQVEDATDPYFDRAALAWMLVEADEIWCHNAAFDFTVLAYNGIFVPFEKRRCTMARAYAHSLPGKLADLCTVLKVPEAKAKHAGGGALIDLFCKPPPKNVKRPRATRETHPAEWADFLAYAGSDIEALRVLDERLPMWNYQGRELELWHLDQMVNARGIAVDYELAEAAIDIATKEQKRLKGKVQDATYNDIIGAPEVQSATQRDAMLAHILNTYGVDLPDLKAGTLERRLDDPSIPEPVKELLRIRLMTAKTSVSKYKALIAGMNTDGILRGLLQWCGAGRTGRWSGRVFQPQNLIRTPKHLAKEMGVAIAAILSDCVDLLYDNVMEVCAAATRGALVARKGKKLVCADLANIEGRVLAWLAGELWKLQAFRDFDAGEGEDLYVLGYSRSFGVPTDVIHADHEAGGTMRLVGKVQELAQGYQGAVGALRSMAAAYGLTFVTDEEAQREFAADALGAYETVDDAKDALEVQKLLPLVKAWRRANPSIVQFWYDLEDAARRAIETPGVVFTVGMLRLRRDGWWLKIKLPSGRLLCYPSPRVDNGKISYMGVNQYTKKWERLGLYSGKIAEHITQAVARDVLAWNMPEIESAGFDLLLTVHDECITETDAERENAVEDLCALMTKTPPWAAGLPLAANGYEAARYRKG